jgi:hypothetical protein
VLHSDNNFDAFLVPPGSENWRASEDLGRNRSRDGQAGSGKIHRISEFPEPTWTGPKEKAAANVAAALVNEASKRLSKSAALPPGQRTEPILDFRTRGSAT